MIAQATGIRQGAAREGGRVRLRTTHDGDVVAAKQVWVRGGRPGHARLEQPRLLEQRIHGERAAVAASPDAKARRVHERQRLHVGHGAFQIIEVATAPIHQELLTEFATVAGAAAHIDLHHDVPLLEREILLQHAVQPTPAIAHGVRIRRAEEHRIVLRGVDVGRKEHANAQRQRVASILDAQILRRDPRHRRELRCRGGGDATFHRTGAHIEQIQLGGL